DGWAAEALDVGARGIFARETTPDDLQTAIQIVHDGLIWARRRVITTRIDQLAAKITAAARSVDLLEQRLSLREREVFRHAATGLGNKQLARRLDISEATVKVHLTHIFQKLGVSGRAELAAAYHGIVNPAAPREGHVE
ncbi:MAG TPA: response regulator transcription factor, partial [Thermoanaerobaculia bacterium]